MENALAQSTAVALFFLVTCFFWFVLIPFVLDLAEWIFNIGGRRGP